MYTAVILINIPECVNPEIIFKEEVLHVWYQKESNGTLYQRSRTNRQQAPTSILDINVFDRIRRRALRGPRVGQFFSDLSLSLIHI